MVFLFWAQLSCRSRDFGDADEVVADEVEQEAEAGGGEAAMFGFA